MRLLRSDILILSDCILQLSFATTRAASQFAYTQSCSLEKRAWRDETLLIQKINEFVCFPSGICTVHSDCHHHRRAACCDEFEFLGVSVKRLNSNGSGRLIIPPRRPINWLKASWFPRTPRKSLKTTLCPHLFSTAAAANWDGIQIFALIRLNSRISRDPREPKRIASDNETPRTDTRGNMESRTSLFPEKTGMKCKIVVSCYPTYAGWLNN